MKKHFRVVMKCLKDRETELQATKSWASKNRGAQFNELVWGSNGSGTAELEELQKAIAWLSIVEVIDRETAHREPDGCPIPGACSSLTDARVLLHQIKVLVGEG